MATGHTALLKSYPEVSRRKLTATEYYRMAEVGILTPEDRVELIEGEIVQMSPVSSLHSGTVNLLTRHLTIATVGSAIVSVQNPVRLDEFSEPEPDLAVLKPRTDDYRAATPTAQDVLLLVEVSASSLPYDRTVKVPLYARHGIAELWIVDVSAEVVEVFRAPTGDGYASVMQMRGKGLLKPIYLPQVSIALADLFLSEPDA